MFGINENLTEALTDLELSNTLKFGQFGFEKESLRVQNNTITNSMHPLSIGSALCNRYITTDFSEAQLELITPPFEKSNSALGLLDDIHHFVTYNLGDEILWPFSMPPPIDIDEDIPIANYGISNQGQFKELYRKGLAERYGRKMQAISGFHFNYSLSEEIWESSLFQDCRLNIKELRSGSYMNMLRNIFNMNWIILYLFGASPIISSNFSNQKDNDFSDLDNQSIYLPYATSLRMSDLGYNNLIRSKLNISINSIKEYISDLLEATHMFSEDFQQIGLDFPDQLKQLNSNFLQIEDEYYAVARAKSKIESNDRPIVKLKQGGVDFIELRSLDLNPFSKIGIDTETVLFLEVFLIFCFFKRSNKFDNSQLGNILDNDLNVAKYGRKPNLYLIKDGNKIRLKEWGKQILDEMTPIAEKLSSQSTNYVKVISNFRLKIDDPKQTLSAIFLDKITSEKVSFVDYGNQIGEDNKEHYLSLKSSENKNWKHLEGEVKDSLQKQKDLERESGTSFEKFLSDYFKE